VLMQTKPYEDVEEDIMQTIATVSTCATLLIGFTLKVDRGVSGDQAGEYDAAIIDVILILLFSGVGISGLYMTLKSLPCFASGGEEEKESPEEKEKESPKETVVEMENQPTAAMSRPSTATKSLTLMPQRAPPVPVRN